MKQEPVPVVLKVEMYKYADLFYKYIVENLILYANSIGL